MDYGTLFVFINVSFFHVVRGRAWENLCVRLCASLIRGGGDLEKGWKKKEVGGLLRAWIDAARREKRMMMRGVGWGVYRVLCQFLKEMRRRRRGRAFIPLHPLPCGSISSSELAYILSAFNSSPCANIIS